MLDTDSEFINGMKAKRTLAGECRGQGEISGWRGRAL